MTKYTVTWRGFGGSEVIVDADNEDEATELAVDYIIANVEFDDPVEVKDDD